MTSAPPSQNNDGDGPTRTPRARRLTEYADLEPAWVRWVVFLSLLAIASVAEFALIRTLLLILLPFSNPNGLSEPNLIAAAVVVVSTGAMFTAGLQKAHFDDSQEDDSVAIRRKPWGVMAVVTSWVIFGVLLVIVRWNAAETVFAEEDLEVERLLAIVMSGVYLATGVFAFVDGYAVAQPEAGRVRRARRHRERLDQHARALDAQIARMVGQIRRHEEVAESPGTDPEQVHQDYVTQRSSIADLGEALRRFAQLEIARRAGTEEAAEAAGQENVEERRPTTSDGATRIGSDGSTAA